MITIGVDAHKRVHVAVAIDELGREIGSWRGPNSRAGWCQFDEWIRGFDGELRIGVEGAGGFGRGLAQHLVGQGLPVFEINARWTAAGRLRARRSEKTDLLDASAIARFIQEGGDLTPLGADDASAVLDLLGNERENALREATRLRNQIHALLGQLEPDYECRLPSLTSRRGLDAAETYAAQTSTPLDEERAMAVRRLAARLRLAIEQAEVLADRIRSLARVHYEPLTQLCGVNLLTAGVLAGMLGPGRRFKTDAQLAAHAGVAPLEASSAERSRHRLNRGGNRRLNAVLYRIALTQARCSDQARAYLRKRCEEGKTKKEAIRALKRYLIRAIWRLWQLCGPPIATSPHGA